MIILLFSLLAYASNSAITVWEYSYQGEAPVAAYFEAVSSSIYVSVVGPSESRLDKFSLEGKLIETVAKQKGVSSALRSYDGKLFWLVGQDLWELPKKKKIRSYPSKGVDIAIDSLGKIYVALENGEIWLEGDSIKKNTEAVALFFYLDSLFYLQKSGQVLNLKNNNKEKFCACTSLERASNQNWLASKGDQVFELSRGRVKKILEAGSGVGRMAHVYSMNEKDDFLVLPIPKLQQVKALRLR